MNGTISGGRLDLWGMLLGAACALHCLFLPLLALLWPVAVPGGFYDPTLDLLFVLCAVGLAAWSLSRGYRRHRKARVLFLLIVAVLLFIIAVLPVSADNRPLFLACGGLLLALGHWQNLKLSGFGNVCNSTTITTKTSRLLLFKNACLGYPEQTVIECLNWELQQGQFWIVHGPNGSGKSTMIKTIVGQLPLLGGTLERNFYPSYVGGIAYLPQQAHIPRTISISVSEAITTALPDALHQRTSETRALREVMQMLDILSLAKTNFHELSGGQKQRVLFARALIRKPRLLILDEPFAGIDESTVALLTKHLKLLHREKEIAILLITHAPELFKDTATKALYISGGSAHIEAHGQDRSNIRSLPLRTHYTGLAI